jgi:hypothetical protein
VTRRVTMADAARVLSISKEAARKRIQRGTLRSDVGEDGRRYVYLDAGRDAGQTVDGHAQEHEVHRDELVEVLREQLQAERQAHAEARRLLMAALERIPPALESPKGARESPTEPAENAEGSRERPFTEEAHEGAQQPRPERSWWRRWFRFE